VSFNPEAMFFDPGRHAESLALIASQHLNQGRFQLAFQFADRRCRIVKPKARDFLLRAEASRRSGHAAFAAEDLAKAIEADPTDPYVLQAALHWGGPAQQRAAATEILAEAGFEPDTLRRALGVMAQSGAPFLRQLRQSGDDVAGWIAWASPEPLGLAICNRQAAPVCYQIDADPEHPLAGCGFSVAEIAIEDHAGKLERLEFSLAGRRLGRFASPRPPLPHRETTPLAGPDARLTVIVPVYEDFEATRACFEGLFARRDEIAARLIVIDDASPNLQLRDWLDEQAALRRFQLIRNAENLGFAQSVNKALALCPTGDVLLLNADTLPPSGFLERLAAAAYSASDIGTVTPLSNNGEFTSFPRANVSNELGTLDEITQLDRLARRANGDGVVDLPNGVGFCLYIRRECLDAVGPLPEIYSRGYYEDVEFCLRAREKGFRNVCATGVFVGHAGSRSFRADKRALVMRNLAKLTSRFPEHEDECAAFLAADALRSARAAMEALLPIADDVTLLVCPSGAAEKIAENHALVVQSAGDARRVLLGVRHAQENRLLLRGVEGSGPQSLEFNLADPAALQALSCYLGALPVRLLAFFDPLALPETLIAAFLRGDAEVELICADLQWLYHPLLARARRCDSAGTTPCEDCLATGFAPTDDKFVDRQARLRPLLQRARAVRPVDRLSEAFARQMFKSKSVAHLPLERPPLEINPALAAAGTGRRIVVLAPSPDIRVDRLIVALAREYLRRGDPTHILVLGRCANDLEVMATANVFVTGEIAASDYDRLIRQCEVRALILPYRTSFFGLVDRLSQLHDLPMSYFDWSFALMPAKSGDLALDPRLCDAKAARRMADWGRMADRSRSNQPTGPQ
jgi:GT2 family glycosyltransferase